MLNLAAGHDTAMNAIMRRWQDRLIAFIIRMGASHSTACDLAQETFVRLYRHRASYNPRRSFATWIFTIAANLARNHHRWTSRHPEALTDPALLTRDAPPDASTDPGETLAAKEKLAAVQNAIAALPQDQRETLILSAYEHLSHEAIAAITNTTAKAVELRLYRARKSLRETLTPHL
jgi:RNA polymerase sigma-70 factor (ECF subfamily)